MDAVVFQILLILLLIIANGVFAMSEMAVVSARKARLQQHAEAGDPRARAALEIANEPGYFLATIQIGITLVGVLAGALGGAAIAEKLATGLGRLGIVNPYSETIAVGIVVLTITYLSLVFGELVPKRLALSRPERIASVVARPMRMLAKVISPGVCLLNLSTEAVLRIGGMPISSGQPVTEEEIKVMVEQGARAGIFKPAEHEIVKRVFRLDDRRASTLMTPRIEIAWLDVNNPLEEIRRRIAASDHSCFPVACDNLDNVLGLVKTKDLLAQSLGGRQIDLEAVLRPALFVPEGVSVLRVLERFKETRSHVALLIDEYGGLQGLVTVNDILEAIVGDISLPEEAVAEIVQRADGSWLVDGKFLIDELEEFLRTGELLEERSYQTLGGFVMANLGYVPAAGDSFEWAGWRFEVVDMDGYRVDKVLVAAPSSADAAAGAGRAERTVYKDD
ncbi:MAG: HlyC/CorC family transporter [Anaerolineae bacterium]|nr:HlyC/CorC family transporter [Anaerolineae bacterium]